MIQIYSFLHIRQVHIYTRTSLKRANFNTGSCLACHYMVLGMFLTLGFVVLVDCVLAGRPAAGTLYIFDGFICVLSEKFFTHTQTRYLHTKTSDKVKSVLIKKLVIKKYRY